MLTEGAVFENTDQRGIQRYVRELFQRVNTPFSLELDKLARVDMPSDWNIIQPLPTSPSRWNILGRMNYREVSRERTRQLCGHQVYHSSFYRLCPVPGIPSVVVVHDMVQEVLPYHCEYSTTIVKWKRSALDRADKVIAISQATKTDLLKCYPELESKVSVIYHGTDHFDTLESQHGSDIVERDGQQQYALFVGYRRMYKNFASLLDALKETSWPTDLLLRVVGSPFSKSELVALRYHGLENKVINHGPVCDLQLAELYRNASVFVFPSLLEGFGFPLLEAQALGVPVAASDIPIFNELGGGAFNAFSPVDSESIARAVAGALEPQRAKFLRDEGFKNYKLYRWEETARRTKKVWGSCLE